MQFSLCMNILIMLYFGVGERSKNNADKIITFRGAKQKHILAYLLLNLNLNDLTLLLMLNKYPVSLPLFMHVHYRYQIHTYFLVFILHLCCFLDKNLVVSLIDNCIIGPILSWWKESCKYGCSIYVLLSYIVTAEVPERKPELCGLGFKSVSHSVVKWI